MNDDASSPDPQRICSWCGGPIPARARRDAKTCSQRCRQAAHRFGSHAVARVAAGQPLRLAYADPPYLGFCSLYDHDHGPEGCPFGGCWDDLDTHRRLIDHLVAEYPDGWALSCTASSLQQLLALCPPGTEVGAWFRGERATTHYRPLSAWEPVIYWGGRAYMSTVDERRIDSLRRVVYVDVTRR